MKNLFNIILIVVMVILCINACKNNSIVNSRNTKKVVSEKAITDNTVPQSYNEWAQKNGSSKSSNQTQTTKDNKIEIGEQIPDSVYSSTTPSDEFYNIIHLNKKVIFYSYADCPIGQGLKKTINNAISDSSAYDNYKFIPDLHPEGSSIYVTCSDNTVNCAQNYLYDNCSSNVCIINPEKRRIVTISRKDTNGIYSKIEQLKNW